MYGKYNLTNAAETVNAARSPHNAANTAYLVRFKPRCPLYTLIVYRLVSEAPSITAATRPA